MKRISFILGLLICTLMFSLCTVMPAQAGESESVEAVEYYNAGLRFVNEADYEKAAIAFQKAIQYDPGFSDAYYNLGSLYEHFGDFQTALRAYEEVVAIEPRDFETILKIGSLYYALNMDREAVECFNAVPQGTPQYADAVDMKNKIANAQKQKQTPAKSSAAQQKAQTAKRTVTPNNNIPIDKPSGGRNPNGGYNDPDKSLLSKYASPTGIAMDRRGNTYIASYGDNAVYVVSPDEKNKLFSQNSMIDGPIGLACDDAGNVYVANYNKDNILKINQSGNVYIFKSDVSKPYGLYISNGFLYVSEQGTNSVIKFRIN